jgi:hypothetical protein
VWVDQQLRQAGYSTITDVYDFRPGENFVLLMSRALQRSAQVLLVATPQAVDRWMVDAEWTAAFASGRDRLVPVVVEPCELPEILRPILRIDLTLHGSDGEAAGADLVETLRGLDRPGLGVPVPFPGAEVTEESGGFPLRESLIFSPLVPPRDIYFTGRGEQLATLESGLAAGEASALVQAVEGLGGVGKSALAIEHCYRSRASVDVVWWVRAEQPEVGYADFAALASEMGIDVGEGSLRDQAIPDIDPVELDPEPIIVGMANPHLDRERVPLDPRLL